MKFTDWSNDANARAVYTQIEDALLPTLARIMPEFNMVKLGIRQPDSDRDGSEVKLVIHLKPNGLRMPRDHDPMDQFNDGTLEVVPFYGGREVRRIR